MSFRVNKPQNLLFICSRNQWRSPTAEKIWKKRPGYDARSAGVSPKARKTVSPADIRWADIIFVMEREHKNRLMGQYARLLQYKPLYVLDIADDYPFMDPELILEIEQGVAEVLDSM